MPLQCQTHLSIFTASGHQRAQVTHHILKCSISTSKHRFNSIPFACAACLQKSEGLPMTHTLTHNIKIQPDKNHQNSTWQKKSEGEAVCNARFWARFFLTLRRCPTDKWRLHLCKCTSETRINFDQWVIHNVLIFKNKKLLKISKIKTQHFDFNDEVVNLTAFEKFVASTHQQTNAMEHLCNVVHEVLCVQTKTPKQKLMHDGVVDNWVWSAIVAVFCQKCLKIICHVVSDCAKTQTSASTVSSADIETVVLGVPRTAASSKKPHEPWFYVATFTISMASCNQATIAFWSCDAFVNSWHGCHWAMECLQSLQNTFSFHCCKNCCHWPQTNNSMGKMVNWCIGWPSNWQFKAVNQHSYDEEKQVLNPFWGKKCAPMCTCIATHSGTLMMCFAESVKTATTMAHPFHAIAQACHKQWPNINLIKLRLCHHNPTPQLC